MTHVFVSYANADPDRAVKTWVMDTLAYCGVAAWSDDRLRSAGGAALNQEIAEAIDAASHVMFLASGMSLASAYCQAEVVYALERQHPFIRVDLEPLEAGVLPAAVLPLAAHAEDAARLGDAPPEAWAAALCEACARRGLALDHGEVDPMALTAQVRIIRPPYGQLKSGDSGAWAAVADRLAQAHAMAPANGFNALSRSLLASFLGDADHARDLAAQSMAALPHAPDAHFAAAVAACVRRPARRRSKAETDAVLDRLRAGRQLTGAGRHLWLLAALVTQGYYVKRHLRAPESPAALLEAGLNAPPNTDECRRAWDVEGDAADASWREAAIAYGVPL